MKLNCLGQELLKSQLSETGELKISLDKQIPELVVAQFNK